MAKSKINYMVLKKTADSKGVMYDKNEDGTYSIGNSFASVLNIPENEIQDIIDKTKAIEFKGYGDRLRSVVNQLSNPCEVAYTRITYEDVYGRSYSFFKASNGVVIKLNSALFDLVKKMKNGKITGQSENSCLVFDDGICKAVILPTVSSNISWDESELVKMIQKSGYCF